MLLQGLMSIKSIIFFIILIRPTHKDSWNNNMNLLLWSTDTVAHCTIYYITVFTTKFCMLLFSPTFHSPVLMKVNETSAPHFSEVLIFLKLGLSCQNPDGWLVCICYSSRTVRNSGNKGFCMISLFDSWWQQWGPPTIIWSLWCNLNNLDEEHQRNVYTETHGQMLMNNR